MTVAVVTLAIALAGALSVIGWLVYARSNDAERLLAMDDDRDKAVQRAERAEYELDKATKKLAESERTIDTLAQEEHAKPNADLAPGNVDDRVVRAAIKAKAAAARRGEVPASAGDEAVHPPAAASGSDAAEVQPAGPFDPNEVLR